MGMYSITPIGSASATASAVAGAYVDYLETGQPMRGLAQQNNLDGTINYYTDAIEGPGMWNGHGAARLGLFGQVEPDQLKSLLEGRHHETGERLTSARGSAGRYGLKVGEPTRLIDSRPVWSKHDLQQRFDLDHKSFDELIGTFAIQSTKHDGEPFYEVGAVTQLTEALEANDTNPKLREGDPADELTTAQAAKLLGVTRQYVGKAIANHARLKAAHADFEDANVDWLPAHRTGLLGKWKITRSDLIGFDDRRKPPAVRLAYDVTFTFEKSVSILGLLANGPTRDIVTQAVLDANTAGLAHFDQYASDGRARGNAIGSEGLTAAAYLHATSRNHDPFLHVHNVIANVIEDANGDGRALDGRNLYLESPTAAALASIELRWQLNQKLGLAFFAKTNGVEIVGIGAQVREAFSSRSAEVEDLVGNISATAAQRARAAQQSRPHKTEKTIDELYDKWWQTANQHGFTPTDLANVQGQAQPFTATLSKAEHAELMAHLEGPKGVTSTRSVFTYSDILRSIGDWTPTDASGGVRLLPATQARRLADDFATSLSVVPLDINKRSARVTAGKAASTIATSELFSTRRMLQIHNQIDHQWAKGLSAQTGIVGEEQLQAVLAANPELTQAQTDFITQWVTSGHQFQSGTGVPGAGKTYTMTAAKDAWEATGYRVIGAAVKGTASRELAAVGITSYTLAAILNQHDRNQRPLDANTILIIDEASTVGDEELHKLLNIANQTGAVLRFLGDTEQHQSVPAGGMWNHLVATYRANTPKLTESHRFKDSPVDIAANQALREDRILDAFTILANAGQLEESESRMAGYEALLRRAVETRAGGKPAPMIEQTNLGRHVLNTAMQHIRIDRGEVTHVQRFQRHSFGVGDDVIARSPNITLHPTNEPDAYIRNGTTGTVIAANKGGIEVDFNGLGRIEISAHNINATSRGGEDLIQLGYALTSYSVQGSTHPLSTSASKPGANKAELLVNISRGQRDNHLRLIGNADDHMQAYKEPTPRSLQEQVAQAASNTDALAAGAIDPTALDRDTNLARIHATGKDDQHHHLVAIERAQRRMLIASPPEHITNYLPPKPAIPHLRQRWENAVTNAGLYTAKYTPRPNSTTPWGYALGTEPDPNNHTRHSEWTNAVEQLASTAAAITIRNISEEAHRDQPDTSHEQKHAAAPTRTEVKELRTLVNQLDRINRTAQTEINHDYNRTRSDDARTALTHRQNTIARHAKINDQLKNALDAKPVQILAAVIAIEEAAEILQADRQPQRTDSPQNQHRNATETAIHQQQKELVSNITNELKQLQNKTPNPLETERNTNVAFDAKTAPHPWLTTHLHTLAHDNKITPATDIALLTDWARQVAIYRERWNANPLSTQPLNNPLQADQRRTLQDLHDEALRPNTPAIALTATAHTELGHSL